MYGINYKKTSIDLREKFSFTTNQIISITNDLLDLGIPEVILLATCNRTELYLALNKENSVKMKNNIESYFEKHFIIDFNETFESKINENMVSHLFEVANGLDSLVLGEDQILGQVKDAHALAMELGSSKKILNKLFLKAITNAKELKTKFAISEKPLSISYIGVEFLEKKVDTFKDKNIMIIGLGEMGKLVLKNLLAKDFNKLYMSNRSHDKVVDLKHISEKITPIAYDRRYDYLKDMDILITATGSPHTIIKHENLYELSKKLVILDLAVPRDVDSDIDQLENCTLFNIDHLKEISENNQKKRENISDKMLSIITLEVSDFINWKKSVKADHLIRDLNIELSQIKNDTLEVILNKSNLSSKDQSLVDQMLHSALKRMVRKPILNLKSTTCEEELKEHIYTMKKLFEL